jgi:hypothetical protein
VRFAGVVVALSCLWPGWGLANQGTCVGAGCSTSATIVLKIVIPPRPLSTRPPSVLIARDGGKKSTDDIIRSDGSVYVLSEHGARRFYTIAKP